jgi:hypothetical protein
MQRNCDGTDPFLDDGNGGRCRCGLEFDDVERMTYWPHQPIPTAAQRREMNDLVAGIPTDQIGGIVTTIAAKRPAHIGDVIADLREAYRRIRDADRANRAHLN